MTNIITIAGQKGGTGKSITSVNLAASLALFGKKTLLIDCDPQACATQWCGIRDLAYENDLTSILSGSAKVMDAISSTRINCLDIMPAGFNLFQVALKLAKNSGNEKLLRVFLKDIENDYEYIIIDSPSSHSFLSISAMTAANWLLVCMSVHHTAIEAFHRLLRMVKYIRATHDVPLKIAGLLFNRYDTREEIESFMENQKLSDVKTLVFNTFIPHDETIKKSMELKIPVALHDIKSPAAQAYFKAAEELSFFFKQRGIL